jgi:probable HAF family extracellular repeat protein
MGINESGKIVGVSENASSVGKATLWDGANVIDLNDYLDQASKNAGWVLDWAGDINDSGSIVGLASNSILRITSQAFLLQSVNPVPEADTSAMLLIGAGVMGFMARRRKNTQA